MMRDLFDPSFTPLIVPSPTVQSQGPPLAIWVWVSSRTCTSTWVILYSLQGTVAADAPLGRTSDEPLEGGSLRVKVMAPLLLSEVASELLHEERHRARQRIKRGIKGNRIRAFT
jgi:hypothetical protein